MSHRLLHVSGFCPFSGRGVAYEDSRYVVLGVPYDRTSTYRSGSRFAPAAVREASANIETHSIRTGFDVEDLKICDLGDLSVTDSPSETIERIRLVLGEIISDGKVPVMLGGEHSISLGGVKAADREVTVVDFDAHMDLRDGYNGESLSHAAVMRRIAEHLEPERIVQIGTRAVCKEELEFARANHVSSITALQLYRTPIGNSLGLLGGMLRERRQIYLTVDMDVLDPAYAPAVGNPEPGGLSSDVLLSLLEEVCKFDVIAVDLTEICPHYDTGGTAIQAAKVLFEILCLMEQRRRRVR